MRDDKKIVIVHTYKGSIYTIDVSEMNKDFIVGFDKFDNPIKLQMSEIKSVIPDSKKKNGRS